MSQEEHYFTNPAEVQRAEAEMTASQSYLSKGRELGQKDMAELGVDGFLETVGTKTIEGLPGRITGIINRHKVEIWEEGFGSGVMKGSIDGVDLSSEAANKIFEKYKDVVIYLDPRLMDMASEKVEEETLLKDIGVKL